MNLMRKTTPSMLRTTIMTATIFRATAPSMLRSMLRIISADIVTKASVVRIPTTKMAKASMVMMMIITAGMLRAIFAECDVEDGRYNEVEYDQHDDEEEG